MWGSTNGNMFVTYGYKYDGSQFEESGEADIWRFSDNCISDIESESAGIELFNPHLASSHTYLGVFKSTADISFVKHKRHSIMENDFSLSILHQLEQSRENIFEKELFFKVGFIVKVDNERYHFR
jgi:hypothetical protein